MEEPKKVIEVEFKFSDGSYYTVREDGSGDTIFGVDAHKVMFALTGHERAYNSASVYRFGFHDKCNFILKSENILNP